MQVVVGKVLLDVESVGGTGQELGEHLILLHVPGPAIRGKAADQGPSNESQHAASAWTSPSVST